MKKIFTGFFTGVFLSGVVFYYYGQRPSQRLTEATHQGEENQKRLSFIAQRLGLPPGQSSQAILDQIMVRVMELDDQLRQKKQDNSVLKQAQVQKNLPSISPALSNSPKKLLTPTEKKKRMEEIQKAMQEATEQDNGKKLLALFQELVTQLGPEAYPLAFQLDGELYMDITGPKKLGLTDQQFYVALSNPKFLGFQQWVLENQALPSGARVGAVHSLAYMPDQSGLQSLIQDFPGEKDAQVKRTIISYLLWNKNAQGVAPVISTFLTSPQEDKTLKLLALHNLVAVQDPQIKTALEKVAYLSNDSELRQEAQVVLQSYSSRVPGFFISQIEPNEITREIQKTLPAGTILTKINSKDIKGMGDLELYLYTRDPELLNQSVEAEYYTRDNGFQKTNIPVKAFSFFHGDVILQQK